MRSHVLRATHVTCMPGTRHRYCQQQHHRQKHYHKGQTGIPIQPSTTALFNPSSLEGWAGAGLTAWFSLCHSPPSRPQVQSRDCFSKEASFRFKFHCLLRNRVLPLSKNRSPEFIFLLQGWAGLASCLDTHRRTPHPGSHFSTSSVLCPQSSSGSWAPLQPPSPQGLLPEKEVPSPAMRRKAPGNTGGLCSLSPLVTMGLPGRKCLFWVAGWPGWALRLSVLPITLPAIPRGGQRPHHQSFQSSPHEAGRMTQAPVKPAPVNPLDGPFLCSNASTLLHILGGWGH